MVDVQLGRAVLDAVLLVAVDPKRPGQRDRVALPELLRDVLGRLAPGNPVVPFGPLADLAPLVREPLRGRDRQSDVRRVVLRVLDLWGLAEASDELDGVHVFAAGAHVGFSLLMVK